MQIFFIFFCLICGSEVPGLHGETVWFVGYSSLQTRSKGTDPGWITSLHHRHSEGTLRHRRVIILHFNQMHPYTQTNTSLTGLTPNLCACLFLTLLLLLVLNYGPDKFPFREVNICLFIKDTIKSADARVNVQGVTSVPYSLFCYNIFLTEPSQ